MIALQEGTILRIIEGIDSAECRTQYWFFRKKGFLRLSEEGVLTNTEWECVFYNGSVFFIKEGFWRLSEEGVREGRVLRFLTLFVVSRRSNRVSRLRRR